MFKMFCFGRDTWKEDDEYRKARRAYEGQGAAATKSAWILGGCLVAMTAFAAVQTYDKHQLTSLGNLKFAMVESCRGEITNVSVTNGTLMVGDTQRRQFIKWWIKLWRPVPTDAVAYARNYRQAQVYMTDPVAGVVADYMAENPIDRFLRNGYARTVGEGPIDAVRVTPEDSTGTRYRLDWTEYVWRYNQLVLKAPMTANIDLEQHTPKTEEDADRNIFGFRIKGFYWTPPPNT